MTLRTRLTAAFLVVVLGPVLLGAIFVGGAVSAVDRGRSGERLETADTVVQTTLDAVCVRLRATAESIAAQSQGGRIPDIVDRFVVDSRIAGARLLDSEDAVISSAGFLPEPWRECGADATGAKELRSLVARVPIYDQEDHPLGTVIAAQPLNQHFADRLAAASGVAVTFLDANEISTVGEHQRQEVLAAAGMGRVVETTGGLYVRQVAGTQLRVALSIEHSDPHGLYVVLFTVVAATGLLSVAAAWSLARSTTRPLAELAHAADRVADGDLDTRVPVRGRDEIGRLATTFNRMTYEMRGYISALTASRDQLQEAMRLSRTDPLTGLANYRHLEESLGWEIERTTRYANPLVILALDLDLFKEVNDSYGHPVGDAVLVEVARRIEGEIREVDRAFRQGGEEFVVLLPETDVAGGVAVAERLGAALRDTNITVEPSGPAVKVTVSIGVAIYPEHGDSGPKILAAADDAMYAAKAAGRDTYRIARGDTHL